MFYFLDNLDNLDNCVPMRTRKYELTFQNENLKINKKPKWIKSG